MKNYQKTKYVGVRVKKSPTRKHKGKSDFYFTIYYTRENKTVFEGVGFSSEGVDAKYASTVRSDIVKNIRLGTGYQSLAEKRGLEAKRQAEEEASRLAENVLEDARGRAKDIAQRAEAKEEESEPTESVSGTHRLGDLSSQAERGQLCNLKIKDRKLFDLQN